MTIFGFFIYNFNFSKALSRGYVALGLKKMIQFFHCKICRKQISGGNYII